MLRLDEGDRPWYATCYCLLERNLLSFERAPWLFIVVGTFAWLPLVTQDVVGSFVHLPLLLESLVGSLLTVSGMVGASTCGAVIAASFEEKQAPPSAATVLKEIVGSARQLGLTIVVGGLLLLLGVVAFLLPALVVCVWLVFAGPVAWNERIGGWPAITRSRDLISEGRWMQLLVIGGIGGLAYLLCVMLPQFAFGLRVTFLHNKPTFAVVALIVWRNICTIALLSLASAWIGAAWVDLGNVQPAISGRGADPLDKTPLSHSQDTRNFSHDARSMPSQERSSRLDGRQIQAEADTGTRSLQTDGARYRAREYGAERTSSEYNRQDSRSRHDSYDRQDSRSRQSDFDEDYDNEQTDDEYDSLTHTWTVPSQASPPTLKRQPPQLRSNRPDDPSRFRSDSTSPRRAPNPESPTRPPGQNRSFGDPAAPRQNDRSWDQYP